MKANPYLTGLVAVIGVLFGAAAIALVVVAIAASQYGGAAVVAGGIGIAQLTASGAVIGLMLWLVAKALTSDR